MPPLLFDTTDARRQFRRVVAQQVQTKQQRMRHARQARTPTAPRARPALMADSELLSATAAMQWLQLSPTPFYTWRNRLGIRPLRKSARQALYRRQDLLRLQAAYLAHTRAREVPAEG